MAEVLWPAPLDTVRLQMDEIAQQGMDLGDAEFAYRLQLREALQASAPDAAFDCISVSDDVQPNEALVHNELQASLMFSFGALDSTAPCSSVLAPFADAVFELMDSFESADIEVGDTSDTWGVYKSAAWVCRKTWRGSYAGSMQSARSIGFADSQAGSLADMVDLTDDHEPSTESCTICLEDVPQTNIHVIGGCLHRFCTTCLQTHIHSKLEDRQFPIPCPHPSCTTAITTDECDMTLRSSQDRQLLAQLAAEASIPEACKFYCPYPTCSSLMVAEQTGPNTSAECPACHRLLCLWCRTPCTPAKHVEKPRKASKQARSHGSSSHSSSSSQQDQQQQAAKTDDGSLMQLAKQCRWRQCQRCKHMIELAHGCNHMKCRCGAEFCYQCGAEYRGNQAQCSCDLWEERMLLAEEQRQRQQAVVHGHQPAAGNPHYRTQMCRHFMRGNCRRGAHCNFAHAWEEIRPGPD
ncbi:hypothetical protein ABBQ38_000525 [Trebouxia sp. C0009 RCD-2024]